MGFGDDDESGRKRKALSLVDDAAMEDDDVDEEEDDDDDDVAEPSTHGRYNRRVVRFIEEEVVVDDDVDEDDEDAELSEGELLHDSAEPAAKPSHYRRYEASRDLPEDVEQLEAFIRERYAAEEYVGDATAVNQQSLVPTHLDPKLWMVQCRPGTERLLCLGLMNKFKSCQAKGTPLQIKSAISLDHLKGYFYVEAEKETHVQAAISGMRNVQHNKSVKLVPLKEMVAAITPNRVAKLPIEIGSWVRVRSGPYAHDLGKVVHVNHAAQKVEIKIVPRIDYNELVSRQEGRYLKRSRDPFGTKPKIRPNAKPFNAEECRGLGLAVERRRGQDNEVYMAVGSYIFHGGYLMKTLSIRSVIVEDTTPPFEEIRAFENAAERTQDRNAPGMLPEVAESLTGKNHGLFKGDSVRVLAGEMMNMTGVVTDMTSDGKILSVKLDSRDVKQALPFEAENLVKRFDLGDHVCVRHGMYRGQMGMVIKIDAQKCLILSDLDKSEFWATAKDLSTTQQTSFGCDQFGEYEVENIVELQQQQYGVIVFADRDFCTVLLAAGSPEKPEMKRTTQQEIKAKCEVAKRDTTMDMHGNRVTAGDIVDFVMGSRRTSGTVKYVVKTYVFVKVRNRTENLGYVAVNTKHCTVRGGHRPAPDSGHAPGQYQSSSWGGTEPAGSFSGGHNRGRFFLRGRGRGSRFHRESVMVKVIKGAHRGYRGRIKDETAAHVRVELDAGSRIITIPKDNVEKLESDRGFNTTAPESSSWGWGAAAEETFAEPSQPPKTPFGNTKLPPTTPFVTVGRDSNTSPSYTPVRPQIVKPAPPPEESSSDDDLGFGAPAEEPAAPVEEKPKSPPPPSSPTPQKDEKPTTESTDDHLDLTRIPDEQIKDLIVRLEDGTFGVTRELDQKAMCCVEAVRVHERIEERSFNPSGEKHHHPRNTLKLVKPEKGDWIRVLDGMFESSIGQMVAVDGNDCIIRLDDGQIQIFSSNAIAVTLGP